MIFNTHTHINDDKEYFEVDKIISECKEEKVTKLLVIAYDYKSSLRAIELANNYEGVYAAIGIHPSDITKENNTIENLEELLNKSNKIIAIGEIGLDYHWEDYPSKEVQIEWFIKQIKLANKYNLPIIIHSRDAMGDTVEVLKQNKEYYKKGIMHCYQGSIETSKELEKLGFYFSFAGPLTYKNSDKLKEVAKNIPIDKILVETDDPYLPPVPFRGKQNHPKYVTYVVTELANLRNLSYEETCEITYNNALKVFGL